LIFDLRRHDKDGLVLLSDAMRPRAIAIIHDFAYKFRASQRQRQRHMDLHNIAHSVREWIEYGAQLGI
jgi:hypothetical protein